MGFVLVAVVLGYLILAVIVIWITKRLSKSKKAVIMVAALFILYPFRRFLIFNGLFFFYRMSPLQEIHQTVESPISVYWQDNVWPGFDEYGSHWMIDHYLDGIHLNALALNGEDGRIHLYLATADTFTESEKAKQILKQREMEVETFRQKDLAVYKQTGKHIDGAGETINAKLDPPLFAARREYNRLKETEIKQIIDQANVYASANDLPPMNYRVVFNPLPQGAIPRKLLHADRISIIDVKNDKEIAYSRRYLAYAGFISQISGEQPKFDYKLGDVRAYEFDDKVLFGYAGMRGSQWSRDMLKKNSYHLAAFTWRDRQRKRGN